MHTDWVVFSMSKEREKVGGFIKRRNVTYCFSRKFIGTIFKKVHWRAGKL